MSGRFDRRNIRELTTKITSCLFLFDDSSVQSNSNIILHDATASRENYVRASDDRVLVKFHIHNTAAGQRKGLFKKSICDIYSLQ